MSVWGTILIQTITLDLSDTKCLERIATGKSGPQGLSQTLRECPTPPFQQPPEKYKHTNHTVLF